jgi:hypothetical protein
MYVSLDFKLICEQVLLEEDLKDLLVNEIKPTINQLLRDYKSQKNNPQIDQKLLHNSLWEELFDLKKQIVQELKRQFNIDVNTPQKMDQFVRDKQLEFPFLKTLHSEYIKRIPMK